MLRRRRQHAHEAQPAADHDAQDGGTRRYRMVQRMVSIGDDFFIEDAQGARVFRVDGKAVRVRDTLFFHDMSGNELCRIQERMLRVKDTMEIEGADGETLATVKKALITPLRDRYVVKIGDGPDLEVKGNITDHEFRFMDGRQTVAEVSKRWFRVRDSYGVEIAPGQHDVVILAASVCLDQMSNPAR